MSDALHQLAQELREEGGLLAGTVSEDGVQPQPHGEAVAGRGEGYPLLVEAIREGYLQHYACGRVVQPEDPDLALLAGDRLYALGLERLAAIGDLDAVAELADVIALVRAGARRRRSGARGRRLDGRGRRRRGRSCS